MKITKNEDGEFRAVCECGLEGEFLESMASAAAEKDLEIERLRNENAWMRSRGLDRAWDAMCVKDDDRGFLIKAIHRERAAVVRLNKCISHATDLLRDYAASDRRVYGRAAESVIAALRAGDSECCKAGSGGAK